MSRVERSCSSRAMVDEVEDGTDGACPAPDLPPIVSAKTPQYAAASAAAHTPLSRMSTPAISVGRAPRPS
jgi:hypothetical protein